MASKEEYLKGKRKVRKLSSMIRREFDSGVDNRRRPNPYKKDQTVNRSDKTDKVIPQTVNKTDKRDRVIPQTVNRSTKSDKVKVQIVNRTDKGDRVIPQTVNRSGKGDLSLRKDIGRRRYTTEVGPRKQPQYSSPIGPRKPGVTAITAGPGRMGSQTVTAAASPSGPPSGTSRVRPTATAGTGTSTGAAEKMSNFERLKARQYEKEGYGGRSMTRKKATEQVMKERQYKSPLAGLFKRKGK